MSNPTMQICEGRKILHEKQEYFYTYDLRGKIDEFLTFRTTLFGRHKVAPTTFLKIILPFSL